MMTDDEPEATAKVGDLYFLVKISPERGRARRDLYEQPLCTNVAGVPILHGWAGSTNNTSREALGLVRVTRTSRLSDVAASHYEALEGDEEEKALAKLGWRESDGRLVRLDD